MQKNRPGIAGPINLLSVLKGVMLQLKRLGGLLLRIIGSQLGREEYKFDSMYSPSWNQVAIDICESNMRLCCLCLRRRSRVAHHMMYINLIWHALTGFIIPLRTKRKNKEKAFLHAVGVCKECHDRLHNGDLSDSWKVVPYQRWLNRNSWTMRWRLRLGWFISWLITLPIQLWNKRILPTILLHLQISHKRQKPIRRKRSVREVEKALQELLGPSKTK